MNNVVINDEPIFEHEMLFERSTLPCGDDPQTS